MFRAAKRRVDEFFEITRTGSSFLNEFAAGVVIYLSVVRILRYQLRITDHFYSERDLDDPKSFIFTSGALLSGATTIVSGFLVNIPIVYSHGMSEDYILANTYNTSIYNPAFTVSAISGVLMIILGLSLGTEFFLGIISSSKLRVGITIGTLIYMTSAGLQKIVNDLSGDRSFLTMVSTDLVGFVIAMAVGTHFYSRKKKSFFIVMIVISFVVDNLVTYMTSGMIVPADLRTQYTILKEDYQRSLLKFGKPGFWDWVAGLDLALSMFYDIFGTFLSIVQFMFFPDLVFNRSHYINLIGNTKTSKIALVYIISGVATIVAASIGCSPVVPLLDSSISRIVGGRTSLSSIVAGILFILTAFASQLIYLIPNAVVTPLFVLMASEFVSKIAKIEWYKLEGMVVPFGILVFIPSSKSLVAGISVGVVLLFLRRAMKKEKRSKINKKGVFFTIISMYAFLTKTSFASRR